MVNGIIRELGIDIRTLMLIFNHGEERVTLKYIGVTQEQIDNSTRGFRL